MPFGFEDLQRGMLFLNKIQDRLDEERENITLSIQEANEAQSWWNEDQDNVEIDNPVEESVAEYNLDERDHDSSLFTFDDTESVTTEKTGFTTQSSLHAALGVAVFQATFEGEDESEIVEEGRFYTLKELRIALWEISQQVTWNRFQDIVDAVGIKPNTDMWEWFYEANLGQCKNSNKRHEYSREKRCIMCSTPICKDCQFCILNHCITLTASELKFSGREQKDSLAVQRIYSNCKREPCTPRFEAITELCVCTEFLTKPEHDCENDHFHHCEGCFEVVLRTLRATNTATVKLQALKPPKEILSIDGETLMHYYTCDKGHASDIDAQRVCRLCLGMCGPHALNDFGQLPMVEHGWNGGTRWNKGTCYHFLS